MTMIVREMGSADYPEVIDLWRRTQGVGLSSADSEESICNFLERNPALSFVAVVDGTIAATVLCGHDGRRGYIHHLAVDGQFRRKGIGGELVARCLDALKKAGIAKCHLFVFRDNPGAIAFWHETGWMERTDLTMMSHMTAADSG